MLLVVVPHAVFQDGGVAEAVFVVFVDEVLLVGLPALGGEFLGFQEGGELVGLVGLREGAFGEEAALDLGVGELLVAFDDNLVHAHLLFLVHLYVEYHLVLVGHVVALRDVYLGILVAFVVEVFLGQVFGAVYDVGRHLSALDDAQLGLHVLTFRLLQADVVDGGDTRAGGEVDVQVGLRAHDGVGRD